MKKSRFVVITDTHFFAPGKGKDGQWWHRTLHSRSNQIAESIISSVTALQPDFVIHCGDFTGLCEMDNFVHGKNLMDKLGCPWYVVPGNHDTWYPGVRQAISSLYNLPNEQCFYSRLINDINFIFLDTCHWAAKDGGVDAYLSRELYDSEQIAGLYIPEHELNWLQEQLNSHPNNKAVLITHAPIKFKDSYPVKKHWNGEPTKDGKLDLSSVIDPLINIDQLHEIVDTHPNIIGTFSGHWHINSITVLDNVFHCMTSSLREWPFEFRLVELDEQNISITTHGLNDSDLKEKSYLEEFSNDWVAGDTEDREFTFFFKEG